MTLSLALALPLLLAPVQEPLVPPTETFPVTRVVDGDTIWIERDGTREKLRLLSVDTEEKISTWHADSDSKPQTVFGEETKLWAQEYFAAHAEPGKEPRIGLVFPDGREERGRYGRLLAEVLLPDGTDFNLLLVQTGRSPYFTKYGYSRIRHEDFVRAQREAQKAQLGIWNPETNQAKTPDTPSAKRNYARLLPWWNARAEAIERFRGRRGLAIGNDQPGDSPTDPPIGAADDPQGLASLLEQSRTRDVEVFGTIARYFEEDDGSLTFLFDTAKGNADGNAFRAVLPAPIDEALARRLKRTKREGVQNYLLVRGRVARGPRGFRMVAGEANGWRPAGPEPESAHGSDN